jgi:hypothetical protein
MFGLIASVPFTPLALWAFRRPRKQLRQKLLVFAVTQGLAIPVFARFSNDWAVYEIVALSLFVLVMMGVIWH